MQTIYTRQQRDLFQKLFDRDIREFWEGPFLGFDILKFTEEIRPDHYEVEGSLADFLQEKYGIDARNLIEDLIGHPRTELRELAEKQEKQQMNSTIYMVVKNVADKLTNAELATLNIIVQTDQDPRNRIFAIDKVESLFTENQEGVLKAHSEVKDALAKIVLERLNNAS